jgi:ABC-2 type transport system ATP-binding protein
MGTTTVTRLAAEPAATPAAGPPVVELRGLEVRYGGQAVVRGIDLALQSGEVYALLGRNGSGKSSLVRTLLGLQPAAAGSLRVLARDPHRQRTALMQEIGYVAEEPQAPPEMTVAQLVAFCGRARRRWDPTAVGERLGRLAIPPASRFRRLSKGQKKQVELALALGHRPTLVVLDDPTLGLDPLARRGFFGELMAELADSGTTVLLTTHDLAAVEGIADRVGMLVAGRLVVDEPLEELKGRFRRVLLAPGREETLTGLRPLRRESRAWGVEVVVEGWTEGATAPGESRPMSLDEIFASLHAAAEEAP